MMDKISAKLNGDGDSSSEEEEHKPVRESMMAKFSRLLVLDGEKRPDFQWKMRYKIIKGFCNGLHFLHDKCRIIHLDLKPENILMDFTMTPKIADFGLSRLFGEQQSKVFTNNPAGTRGYMAPEYIHHGEISYKADIFVLGIIVIEIITGCKCPYFQRDSCQGTAIALQEFTEKVLGSWRNRFESTPPYKPMERYMEQVKQCIVIALKCVDPIKEKRPFAKDIIQMLNAIDKMEGEASGSQGDRDR